jgi:hypothetical protein
MPVSKEFINGFSYPDNQNKNYRRKKSFVPSSITSDTEKSCHDCINKKTLDSEIKRTCYGCTKTNYVFMNFWKQTNASNCIHFNKEKL